MKKKSLVFNFIFITLPALFLALLIAEIAFRIGGNIYFAARNHSPKELTQKNSVRILYLGDSFTWGMGVPPGKSYPDQFRALLAENGIGSVAVYNAAVPGYNSSLVANKLNENIHKYNPDFIIIMVGINNASNLEDSSYFLINKTSPNPSDYFERILSKIRVYKLAKIGYLAMRQKELSSSKEDKVKPNNKDSDAIFHAGMAFFNRGQNELAEEYFDKALLLDPHNCKAYRRKVSMLLARNDLESAKDVLNKAMLSIDYCDEKDFNSLNMKIEEACINFDEKLDMIKRLDLLIRQHVADDKKKKRLLELTAAHKELSRGAPWHKKILMYDLSRIIVQVQQKNIKVILQTYPNGVINDLNDVIREVSRKYALPLVDNERIFEEKSEHMNKEDFVVSKYDNHCSAPGNRLVAENVYDVFVQNNYLPHDGKSELRHFKSDK